MGEKGSDWGDGTVDLKAEVPPSILDIAPGLICAAIEKNLAEVVQSWGRVPGYEYIEWRGTALYVTGIPYALFNGACLTRVSEAVAPQLISDVLTFFQENRLPMTWIVGPETLPDNLGGQLLAAGLEQGYDCRGMAMDLRRFSGVLSPPPDMTLGAVETDSDLEAWVRAYLGVFGFPVEIKGDCLNLVRGLGPSGPWRRFAAFADGGVAAVSSLFLGSQVAGIYDVATAPPFRRRGLGQAMTELALIEARRMGYTIAVLGSTDEGHRLYERMGFLDYCPLAFYVWTGQKPGEAA